MTFFDASGYLEFIPDFTINTDGDPVLIEANTEAGSIWMAQMSHGCGVFGDLTSDVLSWTGKMKRLKKSKRKEFAFGNIFSPVILAALSRLKSDDVEFKNMFYKFEERISFVIIPLGVGIMTTVMTGCSRYTFRKLRMNSERQILS